MNIVLIGFMGSGKTSVGKGLAKELSFNFIDTDLSIEEENQTSINNIFGKYGEVYFRDLETKKLVSLKEKAQDTIISTGGGIILREKNIDLLKEIGIVIYLKTSATTIVNRLKYDNTRPLLAGNNKEEKVNEILGFRESIYEKAADYIIDTNNKTISQIIDEIKEQEFNEDISD